MCQQKKILPWILIPVYQPDGELLHLVEELGKTFAFAGIIIVNDGSSQDKDYIFEELKNNPLVTLLVHAINRGKGQALKTGLNHFLLSAEKTSPGLVTCDADGQHLVDDIIEVTRQGVENNKFTLGVRSFEKDTPFRSKLGNTITSLIFGLFTGYRLRDTQTGLRYIPINKVAFFLQVPYDRFDYEFASLVKFTNDFLEETQQVPIKTIYIEGNSSSHYRPIKDSLTIGAIFFKFFSLSISTAVLDYIIFTLVYYHYKHILASFLCARIASIIYNFTCSKYLVFKIRINLVRQLVKYISLVAIFMCLSWGLTTLFFYLFGGYVVLGKGIAEAGLFLLSWLIQKRFIFISRKI